jgi:uncharacterized protein involved in outer membrane biogenesis
MAKAQPSQDSPRRRTRRPSRARTPTPPGTAGDDSASTTSGGVLPPWRRRLTLLAGVLVAIALLVWWFDWNMLKPFIEHRVEARTGREFHIDGDLDVDLSMAPKVTMHGLRLANVPGATEPEMATTDRAEFRLRLLPLFKGDVELPYLAIDKPRLLFERDAKGRGNWVFGDEPFDPDTLPLIERLTIADGKVLFREPARKTDIDVDVHSGAPAADARVAPLLVDGGGRYVGNAFSIGGTIDSPLKLVKEALPYHVDLHANAGPTRATAEGTLLAPLQMRGMNVRFGLAGPDMGLLFPLIGVAIPTTPPYRMIGRLRRENDTWFYDDFDGRLGDSDIAGDANVTYAHRVRPRLVADVVSKRLDFDDLGAFIGAPPQTGGKETASAEQKRQAAELRARSRVLPDAPFQLAKLRGMDADVKWRAHHVNAPKLPIEAMTLHLFVDDAVLRLAPLDFQVAGGHVASTVRMDARHDVIATRADIRARGLALPKLFPTAELTKTSVGRIGGRLNLTAEGNSIARMAATADGDVGALMGSGRISNLLMEFAGIDIAESLKYLLGKDRTIPIRCAFADFGVKQGVATARQLAFDTTDTVITGTGTIDLRDETLHLTIKPVPKDISFFALRAPLAVGGTFKDPSFHPDLKKIMFRGAAAAVLANVAPPAALLAVFERGPGEDTNCGAGMAAAR